MHSQSTNRIKNSNESLPSEINELISLVADLSVDEKARIELCLQRVVDFTQRRRRILNLVQEALGQLRLDMKYLMFDLEATRRERDEYKKILDENQ